MNRNTFLVFSIGEKRFALPSEDVFRVSPAAELLEVPEAPGFIRGVVNLGGEPVPVADLRKKEGLSFREMELSDRFVFFRSGGTLCGVLAESVEGVLDLVPETVPFSSLLVRQGDPLPVTVRVAYGEESGAILIRSPENLLSLTEEELRCLEPVMSARREAL